MRRFAMLSLAAAAIGCTEAAPIDPPLQRNALSANGMEMNEKMPVDFVFPACNGETVAMSGDVLMKVRFTTTKSGNVSATVSADYHLSGIGDVTGAKYVGTLRVREQDMVSDNASGFNHRTSVRLVAQGNVPNSVEAFTIHVVVANGETRVEHVDVTSSCGQ